MAVSRSVVIDREAMPVAALSALLSYSEREEVSTFSGARLDRTVMSRVLAKYLTVHGDGPAHQELSPEHIHAVPADVMVAVESLSGTAGKRRTATVARGGKSLARAVSSAHCGKYTAAGHSEGRLGIDLERIELRRPEFYRQMFSDAERAWVQAQHAHAGADVATAFTLLWGVKEAFLKASNWPGLTVWAFSQWSVRVDDSVTALLQPEASEQSMSVPGWIEAPGMTQAFAVSARRVEDMLLVAVQYDETVETGTTVL